MLDFFKRLLSSNHKPEPEQELDLSQIMSQVEEKETSEEVPLGRRIHSCSYRYFQLYLDRDITKHYRITVYQGRERVYSFTIFALQGNYDILKDGYGRIINFLEGDQKIGDLPDDDILKGFFYGY